MCWVERNGGNKGGSWGSWPFEFEDEGEVIGGSFAAAIKLLPAVATAAAIMINKKSGIKGFASVIVSRLKALPDSLGLNNLAIN